MRNMIGFGEASKMAKRMLSASSRTRAACIRPTGCNQTSTQDSSSRLIGRTDDSSGKYFGYFKAAHEDGERLLECSSVDTRAESPPPCSPTSMRSGRRRRGALIDATSQAWRESILD
eukprot:TRINITY_DN9934_c0_g1_i1.p1 TRINITY_DN9934_c0_g1~~TRINITY_DN9934_c0_g1_i1.p1  ORF type:complete len:117 (+),score=8.38 TRINITY_DN9934_c0_g1_i1:68-418(+)